MQTFLPYPDFQETARVLDYRRLGKQRIEGRQIMMALLNLTESKAWRNHPATRMWKGYEGSLARYCFDICQEWIRRGYKDNQLEFFKKYVDTLPDDLPSWFGDHDFHSSHRSNLLRKDKEFYSKFGWDEPDDLPYIWPVK